MGSKEKPVDCGLGLGEGFMNPDGSWIHPSGALQDYLPLGRGLRADPLERLHFSPGSPTGPNVTFNLITV